MIVKANTNPKIESFKAKFNLEGDVYVIGHFIESLASHRKLYPESKAETIKQAEQERLILMEEEKRRFAEESRLRQEQEQENPEEE